MAFIAGLVWHQNEFLDFITTPVPATHGPISHTMGMRIVDFLCHIFRYEVRQDFDGIHMVDQNTSVFHLVSDKMIPHANMLCSGTSLLVLGFKKLLLCCLLK